MIEGTPPDPSLFDDDLMSANTEGMSDSDLEYYRRCLVEIYNMGLPVIAALRAVPGNGSCGLPGDGSSGFSPGNGSYEFPANKTAAEAFALTESHLEHQVNHTHTTCKTVLKFKTNPNDFGAILNKSEIDTIIATYRYRMHFLFCYCNLCSYVRIATGETEMNSL